MNRDPYERIGAGYAEHRREDPIIAAQIHAALGNARTVLNVGAGAGSYEPRDRYVVAVEPSRRMRAQRPRDSVPAIDASAEALPFDDGAFEVAMAVMTLHHWRDPREGLREMMRVSNGRVVLVTYDPEALSAFWLWDYLAPILPTERARFPDLRAIEEALGTPIVAQAMEIPFACVDGFNEAYYGRPEAFLDAELRRAQSVWSLLDDTTTASILARLRFDLDSGAWDAKYGALREAPRYTGAMRVIRT